MSTATKEKLLKFTLIVTGLVSILMLPVGVVWPSGFVWHNGGGMHLFQMIGGIYAALGAFMIYASKTPSGHRTFLWFAIIVNIVHSTVMAFQAVGDLNERGHLIGDVPILFLVSVAIWYLMPPREEKDANSLTGKVAMAILAVSLLAIGLPAFAIPAESFTRATYSPPLAIGPHWEVLDRTGNSVRLEGLAGRPTVVVLFRGNDCYHCVQQLKELSRIEAKFRSRGVRLLAISDDTATAVNEAVGDVPFPFPVLSDSGSRLAKSLGSESIDNWHGLLIVDSSGRGRWLISGSDPLMEFAEVFAELDRLELHSESITSRLMKPHQSVSIRARHTRS